MPAAKPIAPTAAIGVLTILVAACGGNSGGSPSSQPPSPPQSSAQPSPAPPPASPAAAANDANGTNAAAPADAPAGDVQAADAQAQTDTYYGQPAPPAESQDDPQAQWKEQRDAAPAG